MATIGSPRIFLAALLVLFAITARWLPHPPNFTPLVAVALFSGAIFQSRYWAVLIPFAGLIISDALLGFYDGMWANYLCFFLVGFWGRFSMTAEFKLKTWSVGALGAAVLFFVTSNFMVWAQGLLYPKTLAGLEACYIAALPFFHNTLASTFLFSAALWGLYVLGRKSLFFEGCTQKKAILK